MIHQHENKSGTRIASEGSKIDANIDASGCQRSCSQNHWSGCSRTQPSTIRLIAAVAAATSIRPSASRGSVDRRRQLEVQAPAGHADRRARRAPGSRTGARISPRADWSAPAGRRTVRRCPPPSRWSTSMPRCSPRSSAAAISNDGTAVVLDQACPSAPRAGRARLRPGGSCRARGTAAPTSARTCAPRRRESPSWRGAPQ